MIARRLGAVVILGGLLAAESAWTKQATPPAPASAPAQPEVPKDSLGRTTPRGTVLGFLTAAGKGDYETATRYLNTRLHGEEAEGLAHKLFVVLNLRLPARLNAISDKPEGSLPFPAEPDEDLVGTISSDTGDVDILVERKNSSPLWLFSRTTLDAIPELYAEVNSKAREPWLLKFLLETKIAYIPLFHWLALLIGLPLLHLTGIRLNQVLSPLLGSFLRRVYKNPDLPNPEFLAMPVRLLLLAVIIHWMLSAITLPLLARQAWSSIAAITLIIGCGWLMVRLNRWLENGMRLRLGRRNLTGGLSILRFARSAFDSLIIFVGLLVLLNSFGISPTTAIAGVGVGGIAVALAAQKTLENVIAGLALISDKAIRVGDFLKVGDTLGTVADIGLRSTRIRTLDRTMVNVPNGQIANTSLENYSLRDQFWFHPTLRLTYETTVTQLRSILAGLTNLLKQRSDVDELSIRVRFLGFGESSLNVEIFAYVYAQDWNDFLRVQEELLLQVMDLVQAAGARIALPSQITYLNTSFSRDGSVEAPSQMLASEERAAQPKPKRSIAKA